MQRKMGRVVFDCGIISLGHFLVHMNTFLAMYLNQNFPVLKEGFRPNNKKINIYNIKQCSWTIFNEVGHGGSRDRKRGCLFRDRLRFLLQSNCGTSSSRFVINRFFFFSPSKRNMGLCISLFFFCCYAWNSKKQNSI